MAPHVPPTPEQMEAMKYEWIEKYDPVTAPSGLTYGLYDTKSRGNSTQGSYWYSLPEGYEDDATTTYPVIIWLHGGTARASQGSVAVNMYNEAMKAGKMPKTIIVLPQALPVGWYINSIDHVYPIEDVMIKDFIPHIDATLRSNGTRGIEGFSMGGYGAAHLGFKFSELFRGVSSIAPAVLSSLANEPKERVWDTFRGDQNYYDLNHPLFIMKEKKETLSASGILVRFLSGGDDLRLAKAIEAMSAVADDVGIKHYRKDVLGAGHEYDLILNGLADEAFTFWKDAFA